MKLIVSSWPTVHITPCSFLFFYQISHDLVRMFDAMQLVWSRVGGMIFFALAHMLDASEPTHKPLPHCYVVASKALITLLESDSYFGFVSCD